MSGKNNNGLNADSSLLEVAAREFDIYIEMRMRTAIAVQAMYKRKGIIMTLDEALEKLLDPDFVAKMISVLVDFPEKDQVSLNTEELDNDISELVRLFNSLEEEEE